MPNLTRSTGNTGGLIKDVAALTAINSKNNRELKLYDGSRYITSAVDGGAGIQLASLNYANPIGDSAPDPQTAINTGNISTNTDDISTLQSDNPNNQTGTSYTVALGDENKTVWMNNAAANTLTIPLNVTETFDINTLIMVMMEGLGITKLQAVAGVTLNGIDGGFVDIIAINSGATLAKRDTNRWIVTGNISEVA